MYRNAYLLTSLASLAVLWTRRTASPRIDSQRLPPRRLPAAGRDLGLSALKREEAPLRREPAGVAAQGAVGRDDPVAGDHDGDRVRAERGPGGTGRLLVPGLPRDDLVCRELAVRDARRRHQDPLLKRRERGKVNLNIEPLAPAGEVLVELGQHAVAAPPVGQYPRTVGVR